MRFVVSEFGDSPIIHLEWLRVNMGGMRTPLNSSVNITRMEASKQGWRFIITVTWRGNMMMLTLILMFLSPPSLMFHDVSMININFNSFFMNMMSD